MKPKIPDVGLHEGIPAPEYHAWHAAHFSALKEFRFTPLHVYQYLTDPPESTPAMALGTALHTAVLEPDLFDALYVRGAAGALNRKGPREENERIKLENPGKELIRYDDWPKIMRMQEAVWKHPAARELLSGAGIFEASAVWHDDATGILCKARVDRIGMTGDGWPCAIDLKTFGDRGGRLTPRAIEGAIYDYHYHIQGAHYLSGLNTIAPCERRFLLLFIEKEPPHGCRLVEIDLGSLELGRRQLRRWMRLLKQCQDSGEWPGWSTGFDTMGVPSFAFKDEPEDEEG